MKTVSTKRITVVDVRTVKSLTGREAARTGLDRIKHLLLHFDEPPKFAPLGSDADQELADSRA
ncbi:MAG: hypothetical protein IPK85_21250 [Gemmatimonadetes bacterium]|nr:hypothetical protein [Gemmatimonadota bacterium]